MTDVIDFQKAKEERQPHVGGVLFCMGCNHEWTAVWPAGTTQFQCPQCASMKGRNKFEISPGADKLVMACSACENQLFNLLPDRVHCPGCGQQWGYDEMLP